MLRILNPKPPNPTNLKATKTEPLLPKKQICYNLPFGKPSENPKALRPPPPTKKKKKLYKTSLKYQGPGPQRGEANTSEPFQTSDATSKGMVLGFTSSFFKHSKYKTFRVHQRLVCKNSNGSNGGLQ